MPKRPRPPLVVIDEGALAPRAAEAALSLGLCLGDEETLEGALVLIDGRALGSAAAAGFVARARRRGARGVIGVAGTREGDLRRALFASGADEVVSPSIETWELAHRIERVLRTDRLEARDIERREQGEAQRALFQAILDAIPVSLYAVDRERHLVAWNRGRESGPFGRPRREVLGERLFDVIGPVEELRAELDEIFTTGRARVAESQSGEPPRIYRVEKIPMRLGAGDQVTHVIMFAQDVTDARAMERSMARAEKLAAVGRLAAGIAHEIKNPLATIAGCAEAMRSALGEPIDDERRAEARGDARVIEDEAYRCKDILDALCDFSRSEKEEGVRACDLGEVVERVTRLVRHNPRLASVRLEARIDEDAPQTLAKADHLVQALFALVLNAADAAPEGEVIVAARRGAEGEALLEVRDDGPGVPPAIRERILEPFFTTKPPGQGTGLGLSVVYGLVRSHGGRLEVDEPAGGGAIFRVLLPPASADYAPAPRSLEVTTT